MYRLKARLRRTVSMNAAVDNKIPVDTRILALMGSISATFASLEAQMRTLLAKLIDTSDQSFVGSFLADDFNLARTTELIRKLSRFRFVHDDNQLHRIATLCRSVDAIRKKRNLFIHGMWHFDPQMLAQGKIGVLEMKWKESKNAKHWSRATEHIFTEQELIEIRERIGELFRIAFHINADAVASKMMPHWQKNQQSDQPPTRCADG
jgi:hypothetical protein